ncbi:LexA family transcriptional repressor [Thermincola ferriacetica]|uniref:LexA repressor n=2 Tax=Thermincola TaxID=278993 RepID=D5XFD3_THEPJ|nr:MULTISPECIES: transcriptional repressor LexA [Thermincola]ADG82354.1 transcriptional repressor, LexA family [Thermincola potens JR]KNZ70847.1 LexA family transcriptional repressor [Thermincola ferriacetica]
MYPDLNARQIAILEFIKREIRKKGYPPSVREIGKAVGLSSSSTVHGHLAQLEEKGYIRRDPTKPRTIEILDPDSPVIKKEMVNVPIVGKVTAGEPILAVENIEDTFPLPLDFVKNDNVFMLSVRGDSMVEAGILDGDYILVRQQSNAKNGDIVVALLGDEATVKTFYKEKDYIRLQPENPRLEPIITNEAQIIGKVIGVFRRIH